MSRVWEEPRAHEAQASQGSYREDVLPGWKSAVGLGLLYVEVRPAFAMFPKDISSPPREWAECFFNVQRWTELPHGGRFGGAGAT